MKAVICVLLLMWPIILYATDSTAVGDRPVQQLKGYKKLFYRIITLHPKLNSTLEKDLLRHYLLGSGSTQRLSDADFIRLKRISSVYFNPERCKTVHSNQQQYCIQQVDLIDDAYFGWALGTISCIYQTASGELISVADIYDFNKKKKGNRSLKYEMITRIFNLIAPKPVRSFLITYNADGYILLP